MALAAEAEADPLEMTPTEKFMFDLQGYLVRAHAPCLILESAAVISSSPPAHHQR